PMLNLQKSLELIAKAEHKAQELGIKVSIVVVDTHGSIISLNRMDGAIPISPRFAYAKAYTSASLGIPSQNLAEYAKEGNPYFGVNTIFGGELTPIAGGLPIIEDGKLVGGIGIGGSMDVSQDQLCAEAALS